MVSLQSFIRDTVLCYVRFNLVYCEACRIGYPPPTLHKGHNLLLMKYNYGVWDTRFWAVVRSSRRKNNLSWFDYFNKSGERYWKKTGLSGSEKDSPIHCLIDRKGRQVSIKSAQEHTSMWEICQRLGTSCVPHAIAYLLVRFLTSGLAYSEGSFVTFHTLNDFLSCRFCYYYYFFFLPNPRVPSITYSQELLAPMLSLAVFAACFSDLVPCFSSLECHRTVPVISLQAWTSCACNEHQARQEI